MGTNKAPQAFFCYGTIILATAQFEWPAEHFAFIRVYSWVKFLIM